MFLFLCFCFYYNGVTGLLIVSDEEDAVVYACWQFFLIVGNHDHSLVLSFTERLNNVLYQSAVVVVESMQGLIEYE